MEMQMSIVYYVWRNVFGGLYLSSQYSMLVRRHASDFWGTQVESIF